MTDMQALFQVIDQLNNDEWLQLLDYLLSDQESELSPSTDMPRIPGLHAHLGAAWMSDDFDDELPDEFWLGEE